MMNDITKYCACISAQKAAEYKQLKTGGNDPSISQRMRYSQRINSEKFSSILSNKNNTI
jgi:hypothetical protein